MPGWMFGPLTFIEKHMPPLILNRTAMFSCVLLEKVIESVRGTGAVPN